MKNKINNLITKLITNYLWRKKNFIHILFYPINIIYKIIYNIIVYKQKKNAYKSNKLKVICIGNIVVGGSGKTPTAISLLEFLNKSKKTSKIAFISKGYGRRKNKKESVIKVNIEKHTALEVGDEPLLLAQYATTYISSNRIDGIKQAESDGIDIVILDDGMQDFSIYKDYVLLVVNEFIGFGNAMTLPLGPLREELFMSLNRVNDVIIIKNNSAGVSHFEMQDALGKVLKKYNLSINYGEIIVRNKKEIEKTLSMAILSKKKDIHVLTAIAYPEKFTNTIKSLLLNISNIEALNRIKKKYIFPDHYLFTDADIKTIYDTAIADNSIILTTEKDYVKIPIIYKNYDNTNSKNPNILYVIKIKINIEWGNFLKL